MTWSTTGKKKKKNHSFPTRSFPSSNKEETAKRSGITWLHKHQQAQLMQTKQTKKAVYNWGTGTWATTIVSTAVPICITLQNSGAGAGAPHADARLEGFYCAGRFRTYSHRASCHGHDSLLQTSRIPCILAIYSKVVFMIYLMRVLSEEKNIICLFIQQVFWTVLIPC